MKIEKIEDFKNDIKENLRRLRVEDVSVVAKCICKLVLEFPKDHVENMLMDKLAILLEEKTNEVVEVICNYLNIRRHYGTETELIDEEDKHISMIASGRFKNRLGIKKPLMRVQLNRGIKQNLLRANKQKHLKWGDIARCAKADGKRKMDVPCCDLMENGVCMKADACRFTHKYGAVIKSRVTKFTSFYNTPKEKVNYRSCILPTQNNYYDNMTVLPGSQRPDDVISISSSDEGRNVTIRSPPTILEPPNILDSALWYKEMGIVISETDTDVSSSPEDSPRPKSNRHKTIIVSNIPKHLNRIGVLDRYFRKFGALRNITVNFKKDSSRALVEFRLSKDMAAANKSVDAVLGNRFIKTKKYKKKKKKKKGSRLHSSSERSSSVESNHIIKRRHSPSVRPSRKLEPCRKLSPKIEHRRLDSDERSPRRSIIRNLSPPPRIIKKQLRRRKRNESKESGEYTEEISSSDGMVTENETMRRGADDDGVTRNGENIFVLKRELAMRSMMEGAEVNTVREECQDVDMEEGGMVCAHGLQENSRYECHDTALVATPALLPTPTMDEEEDVKLERALNDSDVDSMQSDDSLSRAKRHQVMEGRRKQLQEDNMRNNLKKKLTRTTDSLNYYKSFLEDLIIEYRRNDKSGKARVIPRIKEAHAKYMELKTLYASISKSIEAESLRTKDPLEGQINTLGNVIETQLLVQGPVAPCQPVVAPTQAQGQPSWDESGAGAHAPGVVARTVSGGLVKTEEGGVAPTESCCIYIEVPADIVLDPVQMQGHLGLDLRLENMEKMRSACKGTCYVLTMQSSVSAYKALQFLTTNNPMNWHIGMTPPH